MIIAVSFLLLAMGAFWLLQNPKVKAQKLLRNLNKHGLYIYTPNNKEAKF
jgi:hypothetical protein